MSSMQINYYDLDVLDAEKTLKLYDAAVQLVQDMVLPTNMGKDTVGGKESEIKLPMELDELALTVFSNETTSEFLLLLARLPVFSKDFEELLKDKLEALHCLKKMKYFVNVKIRETLYMMVKLAVLESSKPEEMTQVLDVARFFSSTVHSDKVEQLIDLKFKDAIRQNIFSTSKIQLPDGKRQQYLDEFERLENVDPHAIYPTSIYRQSDGCTVAMQDSQTIEAVMSTTLTTSIRISSHVLGFDNLLLAEIYRPLGRVVVVLDDKLNDEIATLGNVEIATNRRAVLDMDLKDSSNFEKITIGEQMERYFAHHHVKTTVLVRGGNEVDKDIENVQQILIDLKKIGVMRHEPVLVVGGGVIADIAGFACALFHRNTPYVMLCTSIVTGIDAGPSPRVCSDGQGFKNAFGAFHPPVVTLTDRTLWKTMHVGMIRHGIAEIVKMAVVEKRELFELLERVGPKFLVQTKFGTDLSCIDDLEGLDLDAFNADCERLVGMAMESYVRAEYGNLWETHQCRPHVYSHTWSPGYEMPAGLLHGHAVATCMGFGAYLSWKHCSWIEEEQFVRICKLINDLELALWHDIMDDEEIFHSSTKKMVQKRGGNLAAPIPRGDIGECGYLNDISDAELSQHLQENKELVTKKLNLARDGYGVQPLLEDVGLAETATASIALVRAEIAQADGGKGEATAVDRIQPKSYNDWIKDAQAGRNADWKFNVMFAKSPDTPGAPHFPHYTLFHNNVEEYAMSQTSLASSNVKVAAKITVEEDLFAPCMVGSLESQFLKMMTQTKKASSILDVGTFTGMSAIAFAEGALSVSDGISLVKVDTLEFDKTTAGVAQKIFDNCDDSVRKAISLHHGDAVAWMRACAENQDGPVYDIIFIDADKDNYLQYYDLAMGDSGHRSLLAPDGIILADNTLSALVYDETDNRRVALHQFNQHVKNDPRVEQVVLTLREGVTMISRRNS